MYFEDLCKGFSELEEVEALALGGSRSTNLNDDKSDYDLYVYVKSIPNDKQREKILLDTCKHLEMNCMYWELEDDCILKNDVPIDIIYRNLNDFEAGLKNVVISHKASNSYTTCMWNNLLNSKVIFDRDNRLASLKDKYNIEYPEELKSNIIERGMELLSGKLCSYDEQIIKAFERKDVVSINHRITAYLETYFNIIFALNKKTHPGEKRLLTISLNTCAILPKDYESNIRKLLNYSNCDDSKQMNELLFTIYSNLKQIL